MTARVKPFPDGRLGFLLARHGRVMNARLRQALGVAGLSPRHGATLLRLVQGPTTQQALIESVPIDPSALVTILNDFERLGFAARRRDPKDRRRHIVEITTIGVVAAEELEQAVAAVEREVFADLDRDELEQLYALLARIHARHDDLDC